LKKLFCKIKEVLKCAYGKLPKLVVGANISPFSAANDMMLLSIQEAAETRV